MHEHTHTRTQPHINLTEWKLSGPTSSGQPSNLKANYKPHYVLSVLFPHHINSAMRLDRLKSDVKWQSRAKMSPVLHFNRPPTLFLLFSLNSVFGGVTAVAETFTFFAVLIVVSRTNTNKHETSVGETSLAFV